MMIDPDFNVAGQKKSHVWQRASRGERSFTLLETIVALGLMIILVLEVASVQGNAIAFSAWIKRSSEATWLAKRVLSQVEYNASFRPLKELESASVKEGRFEDMPDYTYDLIIKEWKFPLTQLITGGFDSGEDDEEGGDGGMGAMIKGIMEQVFGDELLKTAHVTVWWPEGAQRGSTSLTLLLTNQKKIDELLLTLKPAWDEAVRRDEQGDRPAPSPSPSPTPVPRP